MIPIIRTFQILCRWARRQIRFGGWPGWLRLRPRPSPTDNISNDQPVPGETVSEVLDKEEERQ